MGDALITGNQPSRKPILTRDSDSRLGVLETVVGASR
jgi:hypothetical protein